MTGKAYSLHTRTKKNGEKVYYCQFRLPSGKWSNSKSTGIIATTDTPVKGRRKSPCLREAEAWAEAKLTGGQIVKKETVTLFEFTGYDFFDYGNNWEMNKRFSRKKTPSPRWCMERRDMLKNHVIPAMGEYRLVLIDEVAIENFRNEYMKAGYSKSFIDKLLGCIKAILHEAHKQRLIPRIPDIELSGGEERRRGKLTRAEVEKLFSVPWDNERAFLASAVAASTGMRLSEIQALTIGDIHPIDGTFIICKAWERRTQTVKPRTKNGQARPGRLPESVLQLVQEYITRHPYRDNPDAFLFYSNKPDRPASDTILIRPFNAAVANIGIDRKARGVCFHSWRYYANSALIEAGIPAETVRALIGHTQDSGEMTQRYYRPENTAIGLEAIKKAMPLHIEYTGGDHEIH